MTLQCHHFHSYSRFEKPGFPYLFSGASSLKGGLSYAQCYGRHQFRVWAGQLVKQFIFLKFQLPVHFPLLQPKNIGNPKDEPGAIVCRVAQSFLRFGSFQIHASRGEQHFNIVQTIADYTIKHHFPHIENMTKSDSLSFFTNDKSNAVIDLTSNKYADNMSILGLTIDYGPFGFLDAFDPTFTPNTTDLPGRKYCFANQLGAGSWNIA
ncbi:hypothetical protein L1887_18856 [Cichorium endivia]|nr:hypothetical protein L1887_18856 [Cichorium endivia]